MKDIAGKRWHMINQAHVAELIDLGLVEMRNDRPVLTTAEQNTVGRLSQGCSVITFRIMS